MFLPKFPLRGDVPYKNLEQPQHGQWGSYIVQIQDREHVRHPFGANRADQTRPAYLLEAVPLGNDPRDLVAENLVLSDFGSADIDQIYHLVTMTSVFEVGAFTKGQQRDDEYLQSMAEVLGTMPKDLLQRWEARASYLDEDGNVLAEPLGGSASDSLHVQIKAQKPRDMSTKETCLFEDFICSALRWQPKDRLTAAQLLQHPWLNLDGC
ncbi:hypothetical protein ANO11243_049510 [Dothideomycetidae sp. 11243]|nr:hypothetical protein ANO11243_049510 [fungal sp. No.11243]